MSFFFSSAVTLLEYISMSDWDIATSAINAVPT